MITVPIIDRSTIDAWPIARSGLPPRVVNSCTTADILTVGDLRTCSRDRLLSLHSLGITSLSHIENYFEVCERLEKGQLRFDHFANALRLFLDDDEYDVIYRRFGLASPTRTLKRTHTTLQKIGDHTHRTRERIRQIQDTALDNLTSHIAEVCLQVFSEICQRFIRERGGFVSLKELKVLSHEAAFIDLNAYGVLLLLKELFPSMISFYHGGFSIYHESTLIDLMTQLTGILDNSHSVMSVPSIAASLSKDTDLPDHLVSGLLDHSNHVIGTTDGRYFSIRSGTNAYIKELLQEVDGTIHYRKITERFNDSVNPASRKGSGFILEALKNCPNCVRVNRGMYELGETVSGDQ